MTGQDEVNLVTQILGDEAPDSNYILQLINVSKVMIEMGINPAKNDGGHRPWKVLSSLDTSQTVNGSNTYLNPFPLPANFVRYLGESSLTQGMLRLFDGNTNIQYLYEVPIENILEYKDAFGYFAVDYANQVFYITGVVPGTFTIYQNFIATTSPITLTTSWSKFNSNFHSILAFDAAARWRLGTDYDDMNQRNADMNIKTVGAIFSTMEAWDTEMAISAVNNLDYPNVNSDRGPTGYGPRGTRYQ